MHLTRATICGASFSALFHHDGRFVRAPGVFALARRRGSGFEILHLERTNDIHRGARPDHPRWAWALAAGTDTLLVHISGTRQLPADGDAGESTWAPGAQIELSRRPRPAPQRQVAAPAWGR